MTGVSVNMPTTSRWRQVAGHPLVRRLVSSLFGGFVLSLMYGQQEGSQTNFGLAFGQATHWSRLLFFLGLGFLVFLLITFWSRIAPFTRHPGAVTLAIGFVLVLIAMALLNWYDPVGKYGPLVTAVSDSSGVPWTAALFFSWFGWVLLILNLLLGGAAVALRMTVLGWAQAALGVLSAVLAFVAHDQLVSFAGKIDHSLGVWFALVGYVVIAAGGIVVVRSTREFGEPMAALNRALDWRPGLPLAVSGVGLGVVAFADSAWFAAQQNDWHFGATGDHFEGSGLPQFVSIYLSWLGPVLFFVAAAAAVAACLRRDRILGVSAAVIGLISTVYTFLALYHLAKTGADEAPSYGNRWANLGAGGWVACLASGLVVGAGLLALGGRGAIRRREADAARDAGAAAAAIRPGFGRSMSGGSGVARVVIPLAVSVALFYPPTLPSNWQNVLITQIAVYLLLAIGLNVVVGWAGLLDLGYIAFYGIGSYTTAYLTGSLPVKPPTWLHFSPLVAIPFAILACLVAGVLLGAPTLRLRGDYLAIVTLGFGEIIQVVANNNPGGLTGGPIGPNVPHPVLNLGFWKVHWGSPVGTDNLPYWYLLLFLLSVGLVLLYRLEGSRIGRAWAAIREDEVAAQATGIRTTNVKLLAFAIGASTSGIAGVFFASQVGYFDPTQFTLQNSILIVAYVVFGGMGSLPGALAGAAALTWLPYFLQSQVPLPDSQMWIGAIVMLMMIFRPAGLIPARRRKAELGGLDTANNPEVTAVPASEGL